MKGLTIPQYRKADWTRFLADEVQKIDRGLNQITEDDLLEISQSWSAEERKQFALDVEAASHRFSNLTIDQSNLLFLREQIKEGSAFGIARTIMFYVWVKENAETAEKEVWAQRWIDFATSALKHLTFSFVGLRQRFIDKMSYDEYLKSPEWQVKRERAFAQQGKRCHWCGSTKKLEVHHNTYIHFKDEWDRDLTVACEKCHDIHHNELPKYVEQE